MAETQESIMLRMGFDAAAVDQGLLKMEARAQNSAAKTKAIFAEADAAMAKEYQLAVEEMIAADEKHAAAMGEVQKEIAAGDAKTLAKRQARAAAFEAARLAEIERVKEAQILANAEIIASEQRRNEKTMMMGRIYAGRQLGNGISPADMGQHSVGWMGAGASAAGAAGAVGEAAEGSLSIMSREAMVMVREGLRGNWSRMLGSFTIFLNAMGGQVKKFIEGLFGWTGLIIGGALAGAYMLYKDISNFNKELDRQAEENAKPWMDRQKAINEAREESIKKSAELTAHITSLAAANDDLATKVERVIRAMQKLAAVQEKLTQAQGNAQIAQINMAANLGLIPVAQAAEMRTGVEAATFGRVQAIKLNSLINQGATIRSNLAGATGAAPGLEHAAYAALAAAYGTGGGMVNTAALSRLADIKGYKEKSESVTADEARIAAWKAANERTPENFARNALDPLYGAKKAEMESLEAKVAMEKKWLIANQAQYERNMATQVAYEGAAKDAQKAMDDNAKAIDDLNKQLVEYTNKYGDAVVAMKELYQNLLGARANAITGISVQHDKEELAMPTIEDLAGSQYVAQLNQLYGKAKWVRRGRRWHKTEGKYDLSAGDGPFGEAARDLLLARKQEQYDITYGNAEWEEATDAQGRRYMALRGGAAYEDKERAIADMNTLRSAGFTTPEMRQQDMVDSLNNINLEISALKALAEGKGINISDPT